MLEGQLAVVGYIVLGLYVVGMLGIGVYCNKKYAGNLSGFLTGGRGLGPWIFALTYGSTYLSASTFIGNTGTAYKAGLSYLMMPLAQVVFLPLGLIFFSHGLRRVSARLGAMTIPQYIERRYKSKTAGTIASLSIIIFLVPYMVGIIKGGAVTMQTLLGLNYNIAVFLVSGVALVYLIFGGYMARAYTDVVQGAMMFIGMLAVVIAGFAIIGGPTAIAEGVAAADPECLKTPGPMGWSNLFLFSTVFAFSPWGQPQLVQTNFTIRDKKTVYASSIVLALWLGGVLCGSMIIGNMGRAYFGNEFIENVDAVFPTMVLRFFPNILGAVILVAVIAAAMSTIDGVLMTNGSAFGVDIYKRLIKKDATEKQTMMATNIAMFVIMAIVIVWAFNPPAMILTLSSFSFSTVASTMIIPIFFGAFSKKGGPLACVASMIGGLAGTLFFYLVKPGGNYILGMPPFVGGVIISIVLFMIFANKGEQLPSEFVEDLFSKDAEEKAYTAENDAV